MTNEEKRNIYNNIQNLYNMDFTTWQEVLAMLYNLVVDVEQKFEAFEQKFEMMLDKEVTEAIRELYENGKLAEIINEEIFSDLNNKIDEVEADILMALTDEIGKVNNEIEVINEQLDTIFQLQNSLEVNVLYPPLGLEPLIKDVITSETALTNTERLRAIKEFVGERTVTIRFPHGTYPLMNGNHFDANFSFVGDGVVKNTVLYDFSEITSEEPFFLFKHQDGESGASNQNKIWGGHLKNITFQGENQKHAGVVFYKTGWVSTIENVRVQQFKSSGVVFKTAFDTIINGLTINECGGIVNENVMYALVLEKATTDVTNAHHYHAIHIENCRYTLKIDNARHIQFLNSKFEQGRTELLNNDKDNPPIQITNNAMEITFISSTFTPICSDGWRTVNGDDFIDPYYINIETPIYNSDSLIKFIGCDFTPNNGSKGAKVIKSLGACVIDACNFNSVNGNNGIYLDGAKNKLINSYIYTSTDKDICEPIYAGNATIINNNIHLSGAWPSNSRQVAIATCGESIIENNKYTNFKIEVKSTDDYGLYSNRLKSSARRKGTYLLRETDIADMIDSNRKMILDLELLPRAETFILMLNNDTTITGIKGGLGCEEITLFNNKVNNITLNNETQTEGYRIMVNKPTKEDVSNFVLNANKSITFKFMGFMWKEMGRSLYEV